MLDRLELLLTLILQITSLENFFASCLLNA